MSDERDRILEERRRLKARYGDLFDKMSALLFRHDPICINFDTNTDEYDPEVETILPRLNDCHSEQDVLRVVHEEFLRWFGSELVTSSKPFGEIAGEIWRLWQECHTH